jgi:signal transduction histidine kinase
MGRAPTRPVDSQRFTSSDGAGFTRGTASRSPRLHEVVEECRDTLLDDWVRAAREVPGVSAPLVERARQDVVSFLAGLTSVLRRAHLPSGPTAPEVESTANHGRVDGTHGGADTGARAELDVAGVTRAYGSLHHRVLEVADERSVDVSLAEHLALVAEFNAAVGRAITADLVRQSDELHRVAHRLRNPLGSATMALTLLRSRVDLGDNARLAEMLERNLQRLGGLIDEAVDSGTRT